VAIDGRPADYREVGRRAGAKREPGPDFPAARCERSGSVRSPVKKVWSRRNEIERLLRRLTRCRRIFSRLDQLDIMLSAFLPFALAVEALRPRCGVDVLATWG
jgi:transposase